MRWPVDYAVDQAVFHGLLLFSILKTGKIILKTPKTSMLPTKALLQTKRT